MKTIHFLFLCFGMTNFLQAQSAMSSLEFLKVAPPHTFSSEFGTLNFPDNSHKTKENVPANGLFIDGIISIGVSISDYNFNSTQPEPSAFVVHAPDIVTENSFRIGSKWYFESATNLKSGIQVTWARVGLVMPLGVGFSPVSYRLAPLSIGSTNFIKLTEKTGLELNLNAGLNINVAHRPENALDPNAGTVVQFGILVNPSIKFQFQKLSIGLDLQYIRAFPGTIYANDGSQSLYNYDVNTFLVGATIGYKF
jgi:hypothetical protein